MLFGFVCLVIVGLPVFCFGADDNAGKTCYTTGGVAGIVIATIVVTIVMGGLTLAAIWYLWRQKFGDGKKPGAGFFSSSATKNCTLDTPGEKKPLEGGTEAYAFDNPYFKDDETTDLKINPDSAEKGLSGFKADNGDVRNSPNKNQLNSGSKTKKGRPFSNIPFPNVFHQGSKKPRTMDDTCLTPKPLERVEVPLRGHDFTGLGFNICGNMRDGIFVKDVLHRGPASESGKIKAGDRIVGVYVSFGAMVYEDALTILSYASPYDVRLELEKRAEGDRGRPLVLPASSPSTGKNRLGSSSFRTGQRLFHPLYRSQSIDDLTQIGKDNGNHFSKQNSTNSGSPGSKSESCPKRSQSIETATKAGIQLAVAKTASKGSRTSSTSSCDSEKKSNKTAKTAQEVTIKQATPKIKNSVFHVEHESIQQKASESSPVAIEKVQTPKISNVEPVTKVEQIKDSKDSENEEKSNDKVEDSSDNKSSDREEDKPTPPPRKVGAHQKRKAPSPPSTLLDTSTTSAVVHRDAEQILDDQNGFKEDEKTNIAAVTRINVEEDTKDPDVCSVSEENNAVATEVEGEESATKRKASSLDDLTKLETGGHKKSPVVSSVLERAVSLDLQQSLPEGNLVKQKMILKDPTFEDAEDSNEIVLTSSSNPLAPSEMGNLKRWEGAWTDLQVDVSSTKSKLDDVWSNTSSGVTNGHFDVHVKESESTDPEFSSGGHLLHLSNGINGGESVIQITSTPVKKSTEGDSLLTSDVDIDDIPYFGDKNVLQSTPQKSTGEVVITSTTIGPSVTTSSSRGSITTVSPITLVIPVIKPDISQYEILPSPPTGAVQSSELRDKRSESLNSSIEDRQDILGQDIGSIQSSYMPVFKLESSIISNTSKSSIDGNNCDVSVLSALDIVNGNGLELSSSSYGGYRTAAEESSMSEESTPETKLVKDFGAKKKHSLPELSGIKVHSGAAGFAKTLIISTPIEGESISLNADYSPPPALEPPPPPPQ